MLDGIGRDLALSELMRKGVADDPLVDLEERRGQFDQVFDRKTAMALVRRLLKGERYFRSDALWRLHTELHGDGLGGAEAYADFAGPFSPISPPYRTCLSSDKRGG